MSMSCRAYSDLAPGRWSVQGDNVIDESTGRKFSNDEVGEICCKAIGFPVCTIPLNAFLSTVCIAGRTIRLLSCYHCWKSGIDPTKYGRLDSMAPILTKKDRLKDAGIDFLKCIGAPFLCMATQGAMIYTANSCLFCDHNIQNMRDLRKKIDGLDRFQFDGEMSAICCLGSEGLVEAPPSQQMEETI